MTPDLLTRLQAVADGMIAQLIEPRDLRPTWHRWSQREIDAITLALAAERPLLLRGEPGCGKTQLARAAANFLGWRFHVAAIHARFEASDLFYRFDAVRRLADAQARRADDPLPAEEMYLSPGPLWQALDWATAAERMGLADQPAPAGHVVLLDEIDKADSDLANTLLDALGSRSIRHPYTQRALGGASAFPLIVITTNEDREMPPPFLRRCIVLDMDPGEDADYGPHLIRIAEAHFGELPDRPRRLHTSVIAQAAAALVKDRVAIAEAQLQPPGVAEFIDLLSGLAALEPGLDAAAVARQLQRLDKLKDYALRKYQGRILPPALRQGAGDAA